ncbi:zinc finger and SCAN domain-containing protein 31 isoform X2 [Anabrus simplex]|uniref:zinc finger and SCAN domain-containing protein 31 isoform X2 n=1 Tax=Anabrus simplex TaxID=316456 RepID=UPI0035A2D84C
MDQKIEIKVEPVWLEDTASTSFPSIDIKDEISMDEPTVDQLVACLKEEVDVPVDTDGSSCRLLVNGNVQTCDLPPHPDNVRDILLLSRDVEMPIHPLRELLFCCNECGRKFSKKSGLREHMPIHSNESPHWCRQCGKSFRRKCYRNRHLVIHTQERRHVCKECGKKFGQTNALKQHVLTHFPFVCKICGKSFRNYAGLYFHMLFHSALRRGSFANGVRGLEQRPN